MHQQQFRGANTSEGGACMCSSKGAPVTWHNGTMASLSLHCVLLRHKCHEK